MSSSTTRALRTTAYLAAAAVTAGFALQPTLASSAEPAANARPVGPPTVKTVTLVTGDVVQVSTGSDGRQSATLLPRPDGSTPQAAINQVNGHLYVVPTEAFGLLEAKRLDRDLFDVTALLESEYDDASRDTLPVMVDYGKGRVAATEARQADVEGAERTVTVPQLGITAFHAEKKDARAFWNDLTKGVDAAGNPTALADGATRVDLDGRVEVALEDSVPQIHAPEAWQAGYDGTGTTVAVLDTGYDTTHPDLAGRVVASANFTSDETVNDGNGHGTHVASTVGGTGAASDGLRKGVAPKADLMVGKVLADGGWGEDSWVLAGMVWAVDQGADVVSMSLGGDTDDGTNPLALAVNELSARSDSLFIIAAGNNGEAGPSTVTAPGSADAALTVGAVDVNDVMAPFSSRGPRFRNGALKPEVVAPGVDVTAARAAGTELGPIVDEFYTTIGGTSMATPHVAGLAAMIKQKHPEWDGDQIKSVIANSTIPVADATGFDAGTGRVDALTTLAQDVLAPASLSLGSYAWPYSDLEPTSTGLTYTNTGDTAVTLNLALTGQDGSAEPTGSMTLAADQVTVPAGGTSTVDVVLDPTIAAPGAYSAVVTATPDDGGGTVRTGLAYLLEPELYDVTVTVKPRAGTQASHQLALAGFAEPWIYEQRNFDASAGEQTATFRVPPGDYTTQATSFGLAADGAKEGIASYEPSFTVSQNTTIVLDENETGRFDYQVDRPAVAEAGRLHVAWKSDAQEYEFILSGEVDRLYARPSAGLGAPVTLYSDWMLSQPDGLLTPRSGTPVALRAVPAAQETPALTLLPAIDGRFRIVDAGSAAAPSTSSVSGAVALVSGTCADLTGAATALEQAGAAAMVAYAGPGEQCAGTIDGSVGLPTLQAKPWDAQALLGHTGGAPAELVTHESPEYMYELVKFWDDGVPHGGTVDGTGSSVSALVEHYNGMGSTSADGLKAIEQLNAWIPERGGVANPSHYRAVPFPTTVTHYISTGAEWERVVVIQDATYGGEYAMLYAPRRTFAGGTTTHDTWFGGPIGSRVSPLSTVTNGAPPATREGDELFLQMGAFTDAAGHVSHSDLWSNEYNGKVYVDGELELDMFASVYMNTTIPAGDHRIRVVTDTQRQNLFWKLSTRINTEWEFDSDTPDGPYEVLPMLGVDYRMKLSSTNSAHPGKYDFSVHFTMPDTVEPRPIVERSVEISWDGGNTWDAVKLSKCGDTSCKVQVHNRAGGKASLRVSATDDAGRTVKQLIVDAYAVKR